MDRPEKLECEMSALERIIGSDNVQEVKSKIADLIVGRVKKDIDDYDYYLFYAGDYKQSIDEAFEKVEKKIVKLYSDACLESAQEAVKRFKDIAAAAVNDTPGLKLRSCHQCEYHSGNRCMFYEDRKYYWIAHDTICAEEGFVNFVQKEKKNGK